MACFLRRLEQANEAAHELVISARVAIPRPVIA